MIGLDEVVRRLQKLPFFANIDTGVLKLLVFTSDRTAFETGETLMVQGEAGDAAYVVLEGMVDVRVNAEEGPVTVARLEALTLVGEIAILIDVPRTATIVARTPLETLKIKKERFFELMREHPDIAIEVMRVLAARLEITTAELARVRAEAGTG